MTATYDAVDLFAGPGGWDVAARDLGMHVIGLEFDRWACETRRAAGLPTIEGDVRAYGPADFPAAGLIASPPCQTFSAAGKGAGREALETVLSLVKAASARQDVDQLLAGLDDERTGLVLEPLRWALEAVDAGIPYRWLAFEQVPTVLPVWEAMADALRAEGYSVATGNLQAEQYGVPQTRKRAVLVARRDGEAKLPVPTHSRYYTRDKARLDSGVLPWVSMAQALGWGMTARPSMTVTGGGTAAGGAEPFGNAARQGMLREARDGAWVMCSAGRTSPQTAGQVPRDGDPTITGKGTAAWVFVQSAMANATRRHQDEPAPTITAAHDRAERVWEPVPAHDGDTAQDVAWTAERPSPTIVGSFHPDIVAAPGWRKAGDGPRQNAKGSVRVTVEEAAALQSFPPDHPWQGTKTSRYQQVGNAIPPLLARAVLAEVTSA